MLKQILSLSVIASVAFSTVALSQDQQLSRKKKGPVLSGSYAFTGKNYCQPVISGNPLVISNTGEVDHLVGTITFDSSAKTFSLNAKIESGPALASSPGDSFDEHALTASGPYSTTSTTITVGGATASATYGTVVKGITQSVSFMDINQDDQGANCTNLDEATHQ
jgi:hypothetical protein